jgi:hypothetical protein
MGNRFRGTNSMTEAARNLKKKKKIFVSIFLFGMIHAEREKVRVHGDPANGNALPVLLAVCPLD